MPAELIPQVNRAATIIHDTAVAVNKLGARFPMDGTVAAEELPNYITNNIAVDPDNQWEPNPYWPKPSDIWYNNPTPLNNAGIVYIITDSSPTLVLSMTNAYGWETSDGQKSGFGGINITWDTQYDTPCYDKNGVFLYNTRWVIIYYRPDNSALNSVSVSNIPPNAVYFEAFNLRTNSMTFSGAIPMVQSYKFINSSFDGASQSSAFGNAYNLVYAPSYPTPNCTNFSSQFVNNGNLTVVGEFDQSKSTTNASQFSGCSKLKKLKVPNSPLCVNWSSWASGCTDALSIEPINLSFPDNANITSFLNNCSSLIDLPVISCKANTYLNLFSGCTSGQTGGYVTDMSSATIVSSLYTNSRRLTTVDTIMDWSNVTTVAGTFTTSYIVQIKIKNLKVNLIINHIQLSVDSIMYIIRNAANTGPITLTIGSTNVAKLTTAQKSEATSKQITLA